MPCSKLFNPSVANCLFAGRSDACNLEGMTCNSFGIKRKPAFGLEMNCCEKGLLFGSIQQLPHGRSFCACRSVWIPEVPVYTTDRDSGVISHVIFIDNLFDSGLPIIRVTRLINEVQHMAEMLGVLLVKYNAPLGL
jgi:hypothetical protein